MLHNWFFKNVVELRMFTNSFLSLIQTCSTAAAAVLLFWLQTVLLRCKQFLMFLCVCGLVGGVLEIPHCTGSGKSWGRYRVQAPGACTKLSQNSRFVSRDNMHTQREIERDTDPETQRAFQHTSVTINWFSATSVGCSGLLSLLIKLWCFSCWWMISTQLKELSLLLGIYMSDKTRWISVAILCRSGSAGVLASRWQHDCVCRRS